MNDMSSVIVPKSDQINAEDFLAGPRTFVIGEVSISPGTEQPVSIKLEGEQRVWRPCKSMSRVLVSAWGPDASAYAGRAITLYRDPKVKWGGMEIGGIRVSHMSHIEREMLLQLTATKGKRAPHIVKVLEAPTQQQPEDAAAKWARAYMAKVASAPDVERMDEYVASKADRLASLKDADANLHSQCVAAVATKRARFELEDHREGPTDEQRGEGFTEDEDGEA